MCHHTINIGFTVSTNIRAKWIKCSNDTSSCTAAKRCHISLTILQKVDILKKLDKGMLLRCQSNDFGRSCRTVYDRKNKEKILNFYTNSDSNKINVNCKSICEAKNAD